MNISLHKNARLTSAIRREILQALCSDYPLAARVGRQPYQLQTMRCIHRLLQWCLLSDPGAGDALNEMPTLRQFVQLSALDVIPDEITILNFLRLLERHRFAGQLF